MKKDFGLALVVFLVGIVFGAGLWVPVTSKIVRHNLEEKTWHPTERFKFGCVTVGYSLDPSVGSKFASGTSDLIHCFTLESGKVLSLALAYDDLQQIENLRRRIIDSPEGMLSPRLSKGD